MPNDILPTVNRQEILCAELPADPCGLVIFGASGDLTRRKLLGSLFELYKKDLLTEPFYVLGCGRSQMSDEQFRQIVSELLLPMSPSSHKTQAFLEKIFFTAGDYDNGSIYRNIKNRLDDLDRKLNVRGRHIFYLSVPPDIYADVAQGLGSAGLAQSPAAIVIEKPFGRDLQSAVTLNKAVHEYFDESQIYRIDHYMGKETVQNILMFRFANAIFEPVWNRNYIDHVQITIAESIGVEHRAAYYETSGAIRDMFQNHMMSMLGLVAMEPPLSFHAEHIRNEKIKLLSSIRPIDLHDGDQEFVRGQYTGGVIDGKPVAGYRQEHGVRPDSQTETYIAARLYIDNWRWQGVPFYLRTGKRLPQRLTEIAIEFKPVPHSLFASIGLDSFPPNVLVLKIQPDEGISLSFQAKRPGSKACMATLNMDFNYAEVFGHQPPEAYQRLLLDCMTGDQTLFVRQDDVEYCWSLLEPVLRGCTQGAMPLYDYPAGAQSFPAADNLLHKNGRAWRKI